MQLDPALLSRIQFGFVIALHFVLPAFTIGLASYIVILEGLRQAARQPGRKALYLRISTFWTRIFAVAFGMGVTSGIVIPFQIGSNWSRYTDATSSVVAPLMAYEALMAFFVEAGFLGVLLFGRKLVPPWAHFAAALMVAIGTLFSAFWILAANSWMQTPAGFAVVDGRFVPTDWRAVIFNPSFPYRLLHTVTAVYLTTAFTVLGVAAWYLRHGRHSDEAKVMMAMGVILASVLVPTQALIGDAHGRNTLAHQPQKLAAIEGLWETGAGAPAVLLALPDQAAARNHAELSIPKLGSLYLTHSWDGVVRGLKDFPPTDRPPVTPVFFGFRVMVGHVGDHVRTHGLGVVARLAQAALRHPDVPARGDLGDSGGLRSRHRRLDHHRSRPPAVCGVRTSAHDRRGESDAHRRQCARVTAHLHRGIHRYLWCRRLLFGATGAAGAAGTDRGPRTAARRAPGAPALCSHRTRHLRS